MNVPRCAVFTLLLAVASDRATAEPLTLPQAIQAALAHHRELQAARQRVEAARGQAAQDRLWPNPELELSAEDMPVSDGGTGSATVMAGLSQTVPFPGKKTLENRIGQQSVRAAEIERQLRERDVIRDVAIAYYRAVAAEKKNAVAAELVALAQSLADATRKRVAAGAAADPEQLRAEIEWERARVTAAGTERENGEARRVLARWIGAPVKAVADDLPERANLPAAGSPHPQLAAAAARRERAELELRRARLEPWPDVTLGVAGGRDRAMDETLLEFRVSVPLPIFDRAQGRRREARALAEIARLESESIAQQLAQDRDIALARLRAAQTQADTYRTRILPKAEEALRLVRQGYEAGKFGLGDLLDTQRTAFEARLAYYDQLLELNTAAADLAALASEEQP